MIEYFQIEPVAVEGYTDANGVYVNQLGAWLGEVQDTFVEPYADEDGDYLPAPTNWRELIVKDFN